MRIDAHQHFWDYGASAHELTWMTFGPKRLMISSDWPVSTCARTYAQTMGIALEWSQQLSPPEREAFHGGTCAEFYGLVAAAG